MVAALGAIAGRLFESFMAPLVIGGPLTPDKPIGSRSAVLLSESGIERGLGDIDRFSHFELGRTRAGRLLAPIDRVQDITPVDWLLAASLHDLVQSTHPDFDAVFRRDDPKKLLDHVTTTLEHVPAVASVGDALRRHSLVGRVMEIRRTDTDVRYWVGHRRFRGEAPPKRLLAWPGVRRVRVEETAHSIADLPDAGGAADGDAYRNALHTWLACSPVTDFSTLTREVPVFAFTASNLGLLGSPAGSVLVQRALARQDASAVDTALGRALLVLVRSKRNEAIAAANRLLVERAHARVAGALPQARPEDANAPGALARGLGVALLDRSIAKGLVSATAACQSEARRLALAFEGSGLAGGWAEAMSPHLFAHFLAVSNAAGSGAGSSTSTLE